MLYTLLKASVLLSLAFSQCTYEVGDNSGLDSLVTSLEGASRRTGQYVVYDWLYTPGADEFGAYYLPYLMTDSDGMQMCHSATFGDSASLSISCSTGYDDGSQTNDTVVTVTYYSGGNCTQSAQTAQIWWTYGWSPFYNPDTGVAAVAAQCSTAAACMAMNFTRDEVTMGSGSRYDFNCVGDVDVVEASLCVDSGCTTCATVSAAKTARCIQTPTPGGNLMVGCKGSNGYLNTFLDFTQLDASPTDYTLERSCNLDDQTNFLCNTSSVGSTCASAFTSAGVEIFGSLTSCSKTSGVSMQQISFGVLLITAFVAIFKA